MRKATVSPMMAQWHDCKREAQDALLLFRLGDFYEAFYEDGILLAKELGITLTKRQEIPMSGIPAHASEGYIDRLVAKGHRVAIAEQIEDPKQVKGLVKRKIVRFVTPATVMNSSALSDKVNNFFVSIVSGESIGIALLDLTTAQFQVIELKEKKEVMEELCRLQPKEILLGEKCKKELSSLLNELQNYFPFTVTVREQWHFNYDSGHSFLLTHFKMQSLDGFGLKEMYTSISSAGALLSYVHDELYLPINHIKEIKRKQFSLYMGIDHTTQCHLELITPLHEGEKKYTLLHLLDKTSTPMGGRLLKEWVTHPLMCIKTIHTRQKKIQSFFQSSTLSATLQEHLHEVKDLERLITRISSALASPRDLTSLCSSLEQVQPVRSLLDPLHIFEEERNSLFDFSLLIKEIKRALVDAPPARLTDGNLFRKGYDSNLDALVALQSENTTWITNYQTTLRESTGIKNLKVGFTKAFGYYIDVSRAQSSKMPSDFMRKQTLVNNERFISPILKEYEYKMLSAGEEISALEYTLFETLRQKIAHEEEKIRKTAAIIAQIDTLLSLAALAKENRYTCPIVDESTIFQVEEGRHPVIETAMPSQAFIPNNIKMGGENESLMLITGPNMAGKSTYLRQAALIAILAQIGSMVPAKKAHIGIIDKVFTRIGASDDLSRGKSTFMVEMSETANILNNATSRSLVILDEIGRGTSTYDGIAIAWAVAEYLLTTEGKLAKTLFATHYSELTALEKHFPKASNYNVAVHESEKKITFLHKIIRGGTDKSYGIHVAKLAGIPPSAIAKAEAKLSSMEKTAPKIEHHIDCLPQAEEQESPLFQELKTLDLNQMTPLEVHQLVAKWQTSFK